MVFVTGLFVGIVLWIVGTIMEHIEEANRDREWRKRRGL